MNRLMLRVVVAESAPALALADEFLLTIRDPRCDPSRLMAKGAQKVKLRAERTGSAPEEFECRAFRCRKIIAAR